MANTIKPSELGQALSEMLHFYHEDVTQKVDAIGEKSIKNLVELTAIKAPKESGSFRRAITYKKVPRRNGTGSVFIWGAAAPKHRITHLLVHGHATANGGRVAGSSFLADALNEVLPEYERQVEEVLRNAK